MSWDAYISQNLMCPLNEDGKTLKAAAIIGQDGGVWAQSDDCPEVTEAEVAIVLNAFDDISTSTFLLAGDKYMRVAGDDKVIRGKIKGGGVTIAKTETALVMGIYEDPIPAGTCNKVVESLGDYLMQQGY
ncbi:MAG: hypothetical protein WDW36_000448 [Sanguina aurantia]